MMTEHRDEIPLPRFEDRLSQLLLEAHEEHNRRHRDGLEPTDPAATDPGPTDPRHGRRARRSLIAGIGAIAAAAALVAGVATSRTGSDERPETGAAPKTDTTGGEDLQARIIAGTDEATADSIVHVVQDDATMPDSERWYDETTGLYRDLMLGDDGAPDYDHGSATPPALDQPSPGNDEAIPARTVDHCLRQYTDGSDPGLPSGSGAPRGVSEAQVIRNRLADGRLVEDGTQTVDGRELIRLRDVPPEDDGFNYTGPAEDTVVLVDPDTYRPISLRSYPDSEHEYVQTFEYLPRTEENLALLSPPVPEGFTQVDALPGDAERSAAGCGP
jgi:hypothetical protein